MTQTGRSLEYSKTDSVEFLSVEGSYLHVIKLEIYEGDEKHVPQDFFHRDTLPW